MNSLDLRLYVRGGILRIASECRYTSCVNAFTDRIIYILVIEITVDGFSIG